MAEPFRPDYSSNSYRVDPIYARMTLPRGTNDGKGSLPSVQDLFGELSQTSQYKVTLHLGDTYTGGSADSDVNSWLISCGVLGDSLFSGNNANINSLRYEFMVYRTSLPGATLSLSEEVGSRQGVREKFVNRRDFEDITMEFYVDAEYGIIRLFEEWLNFINPLYDSGGRPRTGNPRGGVGQFDRNQIFRFRYPDTYKRELSITKFERDMFIDDTTGKVVRSPSMLTYRFINAFPTQITAIPVTYEGSTITKTTVNFTYDRYVILNHQGQGNATDAFGSIENIITQRPAITFSDRS